ncbi:MAG TPA: SufE family protein [Salinivirgaceae bacterium]|nr:SufE family protein [Salinivirgaceae bacterium]
MNEIEKRQQQIVEEFQMFTDWMDRYNYLIEYSKELAPMPDEHKIKQNQIEGCQSTVWVNAEYRDGKIYFQADSDAILTKGLIALIVKVYNGQSPDDILNTPPDFVSKIGLSEHLSPTRANGLNAMIKQIKLYAMAFKAKYQQ